MVSRCRFKIPTLTVRALGDKDLAKSEEEKANTESAIATSSAAIEEMTAASAELADGVSLVDSRTVGVGVDGLLLISHRHP